MLPESLYSEVKHANDARELWNELELFPQKLGRRRQLLNILGSLEWSVEVWNPIWISER